MIINDKLPATPDYIEDLIREIHKCYTNMRLDLLEHSMDPNGIDIEWLGDNNFRITINRLKYENKAWKITGYVFNDFVILTDDDVKYSIRSIIRQFNEACYEKDETDNLADIIEHECEKSKDFLRRCNFCKKNPDIRYEYIKSGALDIIVKCVDCGLTIHNRYKPFTGDSVREAFKDTIHAWNQKIQDYAKEDLNDAIDIASDSVRYMRQSIGKDENPIDIAQSCMPVDCFKDYCYVNIVNYIWNYRNTASIEDLKKAQQWLSKLIETIK